MRPTDPATGAHACRVALEPHRHDAMHPELDDWRANVGEPVVLDYAPPAAPRLHGIDVLSWNVAIGLGRLENVLTALREGAFGGAAMTQDRPLVLLLQEAYRADDTVPGRAGSRYHGGRFTVHDGRHDVVRLASELGLSLRYSPSMRNGDDASDRGNAILCTASLQDAEAVLLPYVRQRRVAVAAGLAGHPELSFVSAHLDTHGQPRSQRVPLRFGAGRAAQAEALASVLGQRRGSLILGADLNSVLGMSDPAVRALVASGMRPARRIGSWRHTLHAPLRLLLDHVFYRCAARRVAGAEVVRLDEARDDRSPGVFGSDHHPLLARIELNQS
ncbi:MAG TPA: endonuclease/exonuclease/phosphatase family protein [Longimicrobiales bacterium]|nr:endonuclease/exonuclease/phosphatase family protein [Longimicrobiales bacterium]